MAPTNKKGQYGTLKSFGDHEKYIARITKTLYYGKLPDTNHLSLPMSELAAELFSEAQRGKSVNRLYLGDVANISWNTCVSPCSLVLALLYLDRLKNLNPDYLERTTPSDLFLVALMVSSKFLFDDGESDEVFVDEWAASGNMSSKELVVLERHFLKAINWELYVSQPEFWKKLDNIECVLARKEGSDRGFFTYTELSTLAFFIELRNLIYCTVTVTVILAATYTAALLTISGSFYLASQIPGTALRSRSIENNSDVKENTSVSLPLGENNSSKQLSYVPRMNKSLFAIDVLKTNIILASIKTLNDNELNENNHIDNSDKNVKNNNSQPISWDWWNCSSLVWLSNVSTMMDETISLRCIQYFVYYLETILMSSAKMDSNDNMLKSTKTRIQDQLESSWHEEWIGTIRRRYTSLINLPFKS